MKESVNIEFITRQSCNLCHSIRKELVHQLDGFPSITLAEFDLDNLEAPPKGRQQFIVPAIWVNDRLWYLGGFDSGRFKEKLEQMIGH